MSDRIEFYKNRSIGDRFSVAVDFLKQNWKALYKNILWGGLPLAIVMGYCIAQVSGVRTGFNTVDLPRFFSFYALLIIVSIVSNIYLYSMTGAALFHYDRNQLTEATGWNELKDTFFRFVGKTVLISLLVAIFFIVIIAIIVYSLFVVGISDPMPGSSLHKSVLIILLMILLLFGILIALAPFLSIIYFPAYFSGKTVLESIKTSFVLGFKNWGSLFVAILLTTIIVIIVSLVFSLPYEVVAIFSRGRVNIFSYIFSVLSAIASLLTYPIMVVIFAFQYFSIVEKEEGISLQSQLNEFENL